MNFPIRYNDSFGNFLSLLLLCLMWVSAAQAQDATPPSTSTPANLESVKKPLWEAGLLGLGLAHPVYPGADDQAQRGLVLPYMVYRGKYLRTDRGSVGVRAINTERAEVDVGFAASLGSRSSNNAARQGMDNLGTLIEFGPRLKINIGHDQAGLDHSRLQFPVRAVFDVSDSFTRRGTAFEPQWVVERDMSSYWSLSTSLGAVLGDKKLADTFYGVAPSEATPTRPRFTAKSGLIAWRAGLHNAHKLTPDVRLFYFLRLESLAGAANRDSPLVQRDTNWTTGIGLAWRLGLSQRSASD